MKRLSQLYLSRSAGAATAAAAFPRTALAFTGALATHFQVRCAGTQRRVVRPTEEGVADLMDDDEEFSPGPPAHAGTPQESAALSSLVASASLYRHVACQENPTANDGTGRLPSHGACGAAAADAENESTPVKSAEAARTESVEETAADAVDGNEEGDRVSATDDGEKQAYIAQQQRIYNEMPVQRFTEVVCAYLRSTENVVLVSSQEEHTLFPVLLARLQEFHISQLLDILECHWSRSTMLRYGTTFKDAVRDRIAQLATVAATKLEAKKRQSTSVSSVTDADASSRSRDPSAGDDTLPEEDEDAIFVKEEQQLTAPSTPSADVILAHADEEITAETIFRALIVTGMSAGRRKRDLAFFQLLGNYFTYFINDYRDPHELVRVLTALARAKIVPSPAFLNLLARRLPVLQKRVPLEPVPAYRALANFARMGHTSMNTFRFLADSMLRHMEKNIREEKKILRQLRKSKVEAAVKDTHSAEETAESSAAAPPEATVTPASTTAANTVAILAQMNKLRPEVAAKERLRRICGLKPSSLTRLLHILARCKAPHQQYLRPLISPVILPMLPYFPPPSFTRLLTATQLFRSNDAVLIEAYVTHVCDVLAPAGHLTRSDVLELLKLLSREDTPVPADLERFLKICRDALKSATSTVSAQESQHEGKVKAAEKKAAATGTVTFVLLPQHMCRVIHCIGAFQRRVEIPLETLSPLAELAEDFARRLAFLTELSVISLVQVDEFLELCVRHQIPDASGAIEQLSTLRRDIVKRPRDAKGSAAAEVGVGGTAEDYFYGDFDVDVRETFRKILVANDFNTYGGYRPLPGPMQVDFREELTKVSAFELLQSVELFHKACPGALRLAPRLFLSRSLLEKVGKEGEVVVEEETNRLVVRQPRAELLTREDLQMFVELVQRTPLEAVRNAPTTWIFIKEKAERLAVTPIVETATQRLRELRA
ncbi:putative mitochondrial mitochondrial RNA binding complex 1 subunit [Leptomonas pyrrhocoris]|uniref:Putative mitochondrial mitochondrial RNA binding complex 1 subunit n=1 Tax=Leptomonas pyrrhocoris TaxID=157538 RepID=A0A0M9FQA0_LEPPY|nr:putative mitochondrial mitochondrial RNA binding complex 1 subunit [Leptomonas pyrrhocoris]KPA73890.1 putative mitochondrial mitochondrial RNA binding complex 1 subunit [Leptomonas pyrrhocoris]|eukprot:XP_015652329.1 putative mitochondrial mitochondrial RNA binding complex 1 subunit [Leptomonas pyrrhocoris]